MTDKSVYGGLFQDPPCLHTDPDARKTDPYVKEDCIPSRYLGKQMMTGGAPPPGQHPDAYFDHKYLTLASPEQNGNGKVDDYDTAEAKRRREAMESKKHNISDRTFQYSSVTQKSTGPGSYYGCFQNRPYEYMTEPWEDPKAKKKRGRKKRQQTEEPPKTSLPNIKTNPGKKGTYGFPGTTIGPETYNENWRAEYEAQEKAERKRKAQETQASRQVAGPFHTSGISKAYLDELPATGVSAVYNDYTPEESKKSKKRAAKPGEAAEGKPVSDKPFSFAPRHTGEQGNINAFPNVWVDPEEEEAKRRKGKRSRSKKKEPEEPKPLHGAWKPNSFEKSTVISSCLRRFY